ncbi:MAG TPA: sn-glycerol-3-phosphate ABC transporter ATP-binding protein UgpC [Burkholderiaceae bacterium]|nr:sn-glycerol-3-phosphate ABC transporter ATP-binding protein UgpC [Burkholderiaceae bacterium]HMX10191.1 sn-glycerol-3-phosphate ABC transporter ATP-binding protein UgpC [Burkholderiaceae bacterium]HMY98968.1 sn-glycerol-3-phosphate ABC transporter ATP-binding protein UgpC [Burkholderiaceae bacterium]HNB44424.1 sn-glycerol-3-phosphate ABC transporter ATP-binding protein UgpC [Burkholderiaceae bacterium]HNG79253.1 sn-glycerol-3-phosphate ABC transporter ATP-binding protein UgpC [Burkholderiace
MSRIDFQQVCKRYAPGLPLTIQNADLTIDKGEFCVFVGPSGCGKSTLLRMVAGLEDITSGELRFDGERMNEVPPARRGVAMVFQSYALYPHMTVAQNMAFGLKVAGASSAEIDRKVKQAAEILQLTPLLERLPKALSGGQRQRVAIGRAIVKEPKVFLFDEPLSNLDAALRVQTRLEIAKLHHDVGSASMIYVTHDQVEAMTLASKIVLLHTGKLIEERGSIAQVGTPMALYHRPASLFVAEFIGSPKMNILPGKLLQGDAEHAEVEVAGQRITAAVDASAIAAGSTEVHLGIRPEHIHIGEGEGAPLPVTVLHVERLGDVSLLYVQASTGAPVGLTVRVEGSVRPDPGTAITLRLRPEHLHLFDAGGMACRRTVELPT